MLRIVSYHRDMPTIFRDFNFETSTQYTRDPVDFNQSCRPSQGREMSIYMSRIGYPPCDLRSESFIDLCDSIGHRNGLGSHHILMHKVDRPHSYLNLSTFKKNYTRFGLTNFAKIYISQS